MADIDYGRAEVLAHLTIGIGRGDFEGVAKVDFAAADSHAAAVDASRFAGRAPYATRACRTVFSHSLELVATAGAGRADYLLGTLRVGDEPEVIGEAPTGRQRGHAPRHHPACRSPTPPASQPTTPTHQLPAPPGRYRAPQLGSSFISAA
ncbi:MAG TPA: hypothetical protein VFA45_10945 [Actinomycetes bacterium]|nr:hypothetical protein [Actinomycetes bacterium]